MRRGEGRTRHAGSRDTSERPDLVQRRQCPQLADARLYFGIEKYRTGEPRSAVDDAVADGVRGGKPCYRFRDYV